MLKILIRNFLLCLPLFLLPFSASAGGDWVYIVKQGDTLWSLAEDFMVDVHYWRNLEQINKVSNAQSIPPGTQLKIPLKWTKRNPTDAEVVAVSGKAFVMEAGTSKRKKLSSRMRLKSGDKVSTAAGASTTLSFGDGSVLVLRENSELRLDMLEFYGNKDVYRSDLKLQSGQSENKINPKKKPGSRFNIHTPSATAAVRGTVYRVTATSSESTTTEVLEGKVEVGNDLGGQMVPQGFGTVAEKGKAPLAPSSLLKAPDLSAVTSYFDILPLRIQLPAIDNAQAYRVQVAKKSDFEALSYNGITNTRTALITELEDGEYYLKVRGIDQYQLEGFDGTAQFVLNAKPEAPVLIQPQHQSSVTMEPLTFSWSLDADITTYHFQLADNEQFQTPVVDQKNAPGAVLEISKLLAPGRWFWRVAGIDAEGAGPFGVVNEFRVMQAGVEAKQANVSEDGIDMRWPTLTVGEQYRLQLSKDESFTDLILDTKIQKSHYKLSNPEGMDSIYLRTKVIEPDGFEGSWGRSQMIELPKEKAAWKAALPLLLILL